MSLSLPGPLSAGPTHLLGSVQSPVRVQTARASLPIQDPWLGCHLPVLPLVSVSLTVPTRLGPGASLLPPFPSPPPTMLWSGPRVSQRAGCLHVGVNRKGCGLDWEPRDRREEGTPLTERPAQGQRPSNSRSLRLLSCSHHTHLPWGPTGGADGKRKELRVLNSRTTAGSYATWSTDLF